jgi:hypothetical protein
VGPFLSFPFLKKEEELQQLPVSQKRSYSQWLTYGSLLRADLPAPPHPPWGGAGLGVLGCWSG